MPARRPSARSRALAALTATLTAATTAGAIATTALPAQAATDTRAGTHLYFGPGSQYVNYGQRFSVYLRLVSGSTELPGKTVLIFMRESESQPWRQWRSVTTDGNGYAAVPYSASRTEYFTARFRGDDVYAPAASVNPDYPVRPRLGQQLVQEASRHNGAPYQYGAAGPSAFDCSGFTMYVAGRLGRRLAHSAAEQYNQVAHVPAGQQQPGDLIFFHDGSGIYHVGFYAGSGKIWAATHTGDYVRLENIWTSSYYVGRLA